MQNEEIIALLSYMTDHNKHHAQELRELSVNLDEASSKIIDEALEYFDKGNTLLSKALEITKSNSNQ